MFFLQRNISQQLENKHSIHVFLITPRLSELSVRPHHNNGSDNHLPLSHNLFELLTPSNNQNRRSNFIEPKEGSTNPCKRTQITAKNVAI